MAYFLTGLNVNSNLLRLIRDMGKWWGGGGTGTYVLQPTRHTVTTRMALLRGEQLCETLKCFITCVSKVTRQCP